MTAISVILERGRTGIIIKEETGKLSLCKIGVIGVTWNCSWPEQIEASCS